MPVRDLHAPPQAPGAVMGAARRHHERRVPRQLRDCVPGHPTLDGTGGEGVPTVVEPESPDGGLRAHLFEGIPEPAPRCGKDRAAFTVLHRGPFQGVSRSSLTGGRERVSSVLVGIIVIASSRLITLVFH
jgi:hypothetical protein